MVIAGPWNAVEGSLGQHESNQLMYSLRGRLLLWVSGLLILFFGLTGFGLDLAFRHAGERAVQDVLDVRVIMPFRSDSGVITKSNALAANTLLNNGVRVFIYPGMSHLKAAVYDGWACVGSANFDNLSLRVNREMNLATSHEPAVTALVEQVFRPDFERSLELTEPLPNEWSRYLAELLADML